jgi:hypothetical protein
MMQDANDVKNSALFLTHFFNDKDEYAQSGHENSKNEIVKIKFKKNVKLCDEYKIKYTTSTYLYCGI